MTEAEGSRPAACRHQRGDHILGLWICADCLTRLGERPTRYGLVEVETDAGGGFNPDAPPRKRQEIVWQAKVATATNADGSVMTFGNFIRRMMKRFMHRCKGMADWDALEASLAAYQSSFEGVAFGDPDYSWCDDAAVDVVDEDLQHWDCENEGCNA